MFRLAASVDCAMALRQRNSRLPDLSRRGSMPKNSSSPRRASRRQSLAYCEAGTLPCSLCSRAGAIPTLFKASSVATPGHNFAAALHAPAARRWCLFRHGARQTLWFSGDGHLTPVIRFTENPVGAAEGCDLLTLIFKNKIKRSQPAAAPTGGCAGTKNMPFSECSGKCQPSPFGNECHYVTT